MSTQLGAGLRLDGVGAAYIRVSTDLQDTERQYNAVRAFAARHGVTIRAEHWFTDEGWARDEADRRPAFQQLLKLAASGAVEWIVVDALDRFGTKNSKQLISYLYRLEESGCKLFDSAGKEWTGADIGTTITAVVEGEKSKGEQTAKSHRVLGGKVAKARLGEWQGGPVRLGFDVVCYSRETDKELWRVIFEGLNKRLKVFPDGRTERFDGKANFPACQSTTEVLRVAPSKDKAKINAAVSVFKRFATESISTTALGHYLNDLGFRNSYGGHFQSHHVESMLEDPIYLGFYTYNRRHFGKFHRFADDQIVVELNYAKKQTKNDRADWVQSKRLFKPLVDQKTWDAVRRKLEGRSRRSRSPRTAAQYLAGLVYCGNCGRPMVTGSLRPTTKNPRKDGFTGQRHEYFCGTYAKCCRERRRSESPCLRNGVFQDVLEGFVNRWLDEIGHRLELLAGGPDASSLTDRLEDQERDHWAEFRDGIARLTGYLAEHHAAAYEAILRAHAGDDSSADDFVDACVACYRSVFDPAAVDAELAKLRAEHDRLVEDWRDLPTKRAKETATTKLASLDARMKELEEQREDAADSVAAHYRKMHDLQLAIAKAKTALRSDKGELAQRRRAEALRAIIQRIECTFAATGESGGGWGKKNATLATVTIYPVIGDSAEFSSSSEGTLLYSSAHSRIKRTRFGAMR